MDRDVLEQALRRLGNGRRDGPDPAALEAALARAQSGLETLAERTAELEAVVPERLGSAIHDGMRAEVLPVARHVAEVRGLAGQSIRRLERIEGDLEAERRAGVEDLALLVELITSGWRGVERRLDRLERGIDRLEHSLDEHRGASPPDEAGDRPVDDVYRVEGPEELEPDT